MTLIKEFLDDFVQGFKNFGKFFSNIVNYALLSFVYFFGVGFTSIFAKLIGKHFLNLKSNSERKSYWIDRKVKKQSLEDNKRQF